MFAGLVVLVCITRQTSHALLSAVRARQMSPVVMQLQRSPFTKSPMCSTRNPLNADPIRANWRAFSAAKVDVDPKKTIFYQVPDTVPKLGDKYAVVEVGGSQVIVEEGRWYTVDRLKADVGDTIRLPRVLLMKMAADKVQLGLPYLEEAIVEAKVVEHLRGDKLTAGKYKPKKHYRRRWGVRDELTKFVVTKIHTDSTDFIPTADA